MKRSRLIAIFAVAIAAGALAAGCGSQRQSVGANDVAVVGDQTISKDQFDRLMNQAKENYAKNKQTWPATGTPQYVALRKQAMQFLVQRAEFEQKASDLGIKVTDADVDKQLATIKSQYFGRQGRQVRLDVRAEVPGRAARSRA